MNSPKIEFDSCEPQPLADAFVMFFVIIFVTITNIFINFQGLMFFLYAGLMAIDMIIFTLMAWKYKYVTKEESITDIDAEVKAIETENKI